MQLSRWASNHKDQLAAVGALAGAVGAVFAGLSFANDVSSRPPPVPASSPPSREKLTPQGYVLSRSGVEFVKLRPGASPPQTNFDPRTWSYTDNDEQGVTFECRSTADRRSDCRAGEKPVFYVDPVERDATVAPAGSAEATPGSCARETAYSHAVALQEGKSYCVTATDWLLILTIGELPGTITGADTTVLRIHAAFWER